MESKSNFLVNNFSLWTNEILESLNLSDFYHSVFKECIVAVFILIMATILYFFAKYTIRFVLKILTRFSVLKLAQSLLDNKFSASLVLLVPLWWAKSSIPILHELENLTFWNKIFDLILLFIYYQILSSLFRALVGFLNSTPKYKDKPIQSYFQIIKIIVAVVLIGSAFTVITDTSILDLFKAMGAISAIMMLIFKDSILGFVSSVQVTTNDMVRLGDWITIPKHNADGTVEQISLTTVKVRNFDNTITTVPTYSLVSDSFQNWRAMQQSGGRRIKRAITIKQSTIRYIEDSEIERFEKIQGIQQYMIERTKIINEHNERIGADRSLRVNGRNMTNIGLYRKYAENYLQNFPQLNHNMMIMVRQLPATEIGLPLEVYCFTNTIKWREYENITADIFDHLVSAVRYFDLEIFERNSDTDKIVLNLEK